MTHSTPSIDPSEPRPPLPDADNAPSPPETVALLDDNDEFRQTACMALSDHGFAVHGFSSARALIAYFEKGGRVNAIILDWKLPDGTGLQVMDKLYLAGVNAPIIFLTSMPAAVYENLALSRGAVDFVDKARGVEIFVKRLRHIIDFRAGLAHLEPQVPPGSLTLRPDTMRAYWKDVDVELTVTEFKIVRMLAERVGDYVSYRDIYDCVRHAGFVSGNGEDGFRSNVRTTVKRIRNKFKEIDPAFTHIENYAAFGYRWTVLPDENTHAVKSTR